VDVSVRGLKEKEPLQKSLSLRLRDQAFQRTLALLKPSPPESWLPIIMKCGSCSRMEKKKPSPRPNPSSSSLLKEIFPPGHHFQGFSPGQQLVYYYRLALQYDQTGREAQAEANYEKTLALSPQYFEGIVGYGEFLLRTGKYDRAWSLSRG